MNLCNFCSISQRFQKHEKVLVQFWYASDVHGCRISIKDCDVGGPAITLLKFHHYGNRKHWIRIESCDWKLSDCKYISFTI